MPTISLKEYNILYIHVFLKTLTDGTMIKQAKPYYDGLWNNETFSYAPNTTDSNVRTNVKIYENTKGWRWVSELTNQTDFVNLYQKTPTPEI